MLVREFFIEENLDLEEGQTWARSGKKVVRKYRCSSGPRKNRIVAKMLKMNVIDYLKTD